MNGNDCVSVYIGIICFVIVIVDADDVHFFLVFRGHMVSELEWLNVYLMADSFMQSVKHQSFMFVIPIRIIFSISQSVECGNE